MRLPYLGLFVFVHACGEPAHSPHDARSGEVPANSLSEARLNGTDKAPPPKQAEPQNDPTQPYLQPVGAGTDPATGEKKTGKVTKAECNELIDKYLSMQLEQDERFAGMTPEILDSAKAQARQQKGDPCSKEVIPRAKYNCAVSSHSPKEWEKCMK